MASLPYLPRMPSMARSTFSTFSLEGLTLLEQKKWLLGGSYVALSLGLCLAGVALGRRLAK